MQRKISNIKYKLHSIPILLNMKNKSNVLYSIPCVKSYACTFCRVVNTLCSNSSNTAYSVQDNNDNTSSNFPSTNVVWWRSAHCRSYERRNRTRASQVVMTPLNRIRSWMDSYSRISSWSKLSVFTFLLLSISFLSILGSIVVGSNSCYAADATSASLSLSNPNMTSSAITPGNTTTVSTNVSVKVDNAESYSLILKVDSTTLKNGSTTINAGNVVNDNTWGYKWDNATTYSTPSTSGTTLTNSTLVPLDSNGNISFTKNLTFGAKFSTNAEAGHYKGSGTLSLVAEPKSITLGVWSDGTKSGITTMQEMTPEVCNQVGTPTAVGTPGSTNAPILVLSDSRDGSTYTIAKLPDGKCWMVDNLHLSGGITLKPSDSNVTSNFTLPTSLTDSNLNDATGDACSKNFYNGGNTSNTSCYTKAQSYITTPNDKAGITGYYSWCAATAGTCTSATAQYKEATASICPKGWKLPTGYGSESGNNDFYDLFSKMNLGVTVGASGSTSWGSSQGLAISQGSPYKFAYTGRVYNGAMGNTSVDYWWSRTAYSSTGAYSLNIDSSSVGPGTRSIGRCYGFAVRCVAEEPKEFTLTFDKNSTSDATNMPAPQSCAVTSDNCSITIPSQMPQLSGYVFMGWDTTQKSPTCSNTAQYRPGAKITLSGNTTLYAVWAQLGCFDV